MIIHKINIALGLISIAGLVGVYGLKYSVAEVAHHKQTLERKIAHQKADLSLLEADWAYLNQPAYIQPIINRHQVELDLAPVEQAQFGTFTDLPMRPVAAPDTAAMTALFKSLDAGVDPTDKPIGEH